MTERGLPSSRLDSDEIAALAAVGLSPGRSTCPDPTLVLAAGEGVLDEAVAARVLAHVESCPACKLAAGDLAQVFDEDVPIEIHQRIDARLATTRARPARAAWFWVPIAGFALVAAIVIGMVMSRPGASLPSVDTQLARSTPSLPTVFTIDRPTIAPADVDLAVRGDASTRVSLSQQISAALDLGDAGDVKQALSILEALVARHPQSRDAMLAFGVLQLRDGKNVDAVTTLERARALKGPLTPPNPPNPPNDAASNAEVDWFIGLARVRTGELTRARTLLDGVCRQGGPRSARACAGLVELDRMAREAR